MGKKGKGKKVEFLVDEAALKPFEVAINDIIDTPLGVSATVIGVKEGALWLRWPGGIESPASPAPQKTKNKEDLATYGYNRRPQSAHIQRSIDERLLVCCAHPAPARTPLLSRACFAVFAVFAVFVPPGSTPRHAPSRPLTSSGDTAGRGRRLRRSSCRLGRTALLAASLAD